MWEICMPNFSPLASMVMRGGGDRQKVTHWPSNHFWPDPFTKFLNSPFAPLWDGLILNE